MRLAFARVRMFRQDFRHHRADFCFFGGMTDQHAAAARPNQGGTTGVTRSSLAVRGRAFLIPTRSPAARLGLEQSQTFLHDLI
ncbi:MAG: hypothetical protein JW966_10480 [Anaerolineae bacterium]|nr:hypothetical protein [Anaerolineae bacterium]